MAKRLQLRGGTTAQHSTFTGALREVTVDTDKDTLVVHDGSTAGGFPLAKYSDLSSIDTNLVNDTTPQLGGDLDLNSNNITGTGNIDIAGTIKSDTWQSIQTSAFNAEAAKSYFVNTTSAAITATLPTSPSQGDEIRFIDYAGTFDSNNLTIARNGNNIQGVNSDLVISTERAAFGLVYVDATQGWLLIEK